METAKITLKEKEIDQVVTEVAENEGSLFRLETGLSYGVDFHLWPPRA